MCRDPWVGLRSSKTIYNICSRAFVPSPPHDALTSLSYTFRCPSRAATALMGDITDGGGIVSPPVAPAIATILNTVAPDAAEDTNLEEKLVSAMAFGVGGQYLALGDRGGSVYIHQVESSK
eukprot:gene3082-3627_t